MASKWNEVVASEKYQVLDEEEKSKVRQRYFDNVITKSPVYSSLPDSEKLKVQEKFFGELQPGFAERSFQTAKNFLWDEPARGAAVLREAGADMISSNPADIEAQAQATGEVPLGKIALRTAAETAAELIPMTPTEFAAEILGGAAIGKLYKAAPQLAERFPTLFRILRTRIDIPGMKVTVPPSVVPEAAEDLAGAVPTTPDVPAVPAPEAPPVAPVAPPAPVAPAVAAPPEMRLPKDLAGAKPRFKEFGLQFESDVDRAAYITAQAKRSARDADYMKFAKEATGWNDEQVRAYGQRVKQLIGMKAKDAAADEPLFVESFFKREQKKVAAAAQPPVAPATPAGSAPAAPSLPEVTPATTERIVGAVPKVDPDAQGLAFGVKPTVPEKDIFGQQLKKFNVSDDARAIFDETSKIFKPQIEASRRGKIDFTGTKKLADDLGMDYDDLIKRNKGQAFNAEELEAAKGLVGRSLEEVDAARNLYVADQSPANLLKLNGAIARHAAVQESFLGARAEAGRALSILRKVTDPANLAQENLGTLLKAIGGKEGVPEEIAKRLAQIDPLNIADMNKFIREVVKAKTSDQVYEIWLNGILSSPLTHIRNTMGNTMFLASKVPETVIQGLVDRGAQIFTGRRSAYATEAAHEAVGFMRGISEGTRRFLSTLKTGTRSGKLELQRVPAVPGKLGEVIRLPTRALAAEDEFAKAIATRMEISGQSYRIARSEGLKGQALIERASKLEANPTPEMMESAGKEALVRTFQDPSKLANRLSGLRDIPGLRYILPFVETPVNIASRALERSPIGFAKAIKSSLAGKGQETVTKEVAQALYGSSIAATIAYYALQGKVTGAPPSEPNARDRFFRSKIPYAIKIGDTWHSYASFEPVSMIVGATADATLKAVEANEKDDTTLTNMAGAITSSIGKYMVSRTFLSGIRDFIEAMADGERFGDSFVKRVGGGAVPYSGMMRYIAYQLDPVLRDVEGVKDQIQSGIPGASKKLRARLDVYGDEIKRPNGPLASIGIPTRREVVNPLDAEDEEVDRVSGFPARTFAGVKLREEEYHELLRTSGNLFKEARTALQQTEGWKEIPSEQRRSLINRLADAARKEARARIYPRVLERLPDGDRRTDLIEYGVENLGLRQEDLMAAGR